MIFADPIGIVEAKLAREGLPSLLSFLCPAAHIIGLFPIISNLEPSIITFAEGDGVLESGDPLGTSEEVGEVILVPLYPPERSEGIDEPTSSHNLLEESFWVTKKRRDILIGLARVGGYDHGAIKGLGDVTTEIAQGIDLRGVIHIPTNKLCCIVKDHAVRLDFFTNSIQAFYELGGGSPNTDLAMGKVFSREDKKVLICL